MSKTLGVLPAVMRGCLGRNLVLVGTRGGFFSSCGLDSLTSRMTAQERALFEKKKDVKSAGVKRYVVHILYCTANGRSPEDVERSVSYHVLYLMR